VTCDSCRTGDGQFLVCFTGQASPPSPVFFVCRRCLDGVRDGQRVQMTVVDLEQSGLVDHARERRP
jgi:hypothetical protein